MTLTFDKCIKSVHIQGTVYDGGQQARCSHIWKEKEAPSSVSKVLNNTRYENQAWLNNFKWSIDLTLPNKSWAINATNGKLSPRNLNWPVSFVNSNGTSRSVDVENHLADYIPKTLRLACFPTLGYSKHDMKKKRTSQF